MSEKPPRVQPVKSYRVPRYPSHEDPDPTRHPSPVPFPYRPGFLTAMAAAGLGATSLLSGQEADVPKKSPFPLAGNGLPFRSSPFGTGQPTYIQDAKAREIIDRVFRESGFRLRKNQQFTDGDVSFVPDGYDPEAKIGYLFAGWKNTEEDLFGSWQTRDRSDLDVYARSLLSRLGEALRAQFQMALALEDPDERHAQLTKLLEQYSRERLSLSEAKELETGKKKTLVALISSRDRRFLVNQPGDAESQRIAKEIQQLPREEQGPAWQAWQEERTVEALTRLERSVRDYIAWARSQGL